MKEKQSLTPDDILSGHSPQVRAIAEALRGIIHDTVEDMTERAYPGWHAVGFRHQRAGYVCGLFPFDDYVRFVFEHGRALSDPEGVLGGDGKQIRFIDIYDIGAIPVEPLQVLLFQAVALRAR